MKSSSRLVGNDSDSAMSATMHRAPPTRLLRARTRYGSSRQAAIKSAAVATVASATHPPSEGKIVSRKGDVSRSMIIRSTKVTVATGHPKFIELKSRQQRERDDEFEGHQRRDDRPANQHKPETIQECPAEQEGGLGDQVDFGRGHDDQRPHVEDSGEAKRHPVAAGHGTRRHQAAAGQERGG